jgi:hypothetical protein
MERVPSSVWAVTIAVLVTLCAIQWRQNGELAKTASIYQNLAWSDADMIAYLVSGRAQITMEQQGQILRGCNVVKQGLSARGFRPRTAEESMASVRQGSLDHNDTTGTGR